jgi:hypothetical protein
MLFYDIFRTGHGTFGRGDFANVFVLIILFQMPLKYF